MITPDELTAITKTMRELGITEMTTPDLSLRLGPAPSPEPKKLSLEDRSRYAREMRDYDEAMLYAHTEGFPQMPEEPQ